MELTNETATQTEAEISEEEVSALVLRAQAGDAEAFGQLFGILESKLERQALFLARDEQQALDLLQETMLEAWKHLGRYDGRARFATWVCSIMAHRHYSWARRFRARFRQLTEPGDHAVAEEKQSPLEFIVDQDRARLMRECLDELPAKQRMVVYLRFYADESLEGIAALIPCSIGTVKSRLFHGMARLARMQKLKELRDEK
jgi:RNA polymerase sigma-70 factor (ECF subfamily)